MKKLLCGYMADAGTCVINGIGFSNGLGDGYFKVYYTDKLPRGIKEMPNATWIDLRNDYPITIHGYDCNERNKEIEPNYTFTKKDFKGADALCVVANGGDIYLVKYF